MKNHESTGTVDELTMRVAQALAPARDDGAVCGAQCADCASRDGCFLANLVGHDPHHAKTSLAVRLHVPRNWGLHRVGDPLRAICVVRSGSFKSVSFDDEGREQITGVHLSDDVLGLEAIDSGHHVHDVIALEDSEVCAIPFATLGRLVAEVPSAQRWFHKAMSKALISSRDTIVMLASMRADARFAAFLLELSQRLAKRGPATQDLSLCLSRRDMASYLGLRIETVSRVLSRTQRQGFISVRRRRVRVLDVDGLKRFAVGVAVAA